MQPARMNLKILLPFKIFAEKTGVLRIVAETREGSFGLLPHRLDCVAALAPGILVYETEAEGEVYIAVDEGVLVKTGADVLVSVRNAIGGMSWVNCARRWSRSFCTWTSRSKACVRCWRKWKAISSVAWRRFIMSEESQNQAREAEAVAQPAGR